MKALRVLLYLAVICILGTSFALATPQNDEKKAAETKLKTFLKVEEGTSGWFNTFVRTLYGQGKTVAGRGQVGNYLWHNDDFIAFHFFTYGGGANTHYVVCVNSSGAVTDIKHVLTQSMRSDNYFNVHKHGDTEILTTEETMDMNIKNVGKSLENKTFVNAHICGVDEKGKVVVTPLK